MRQQRIVAAGHEPSVNGEFRQTLARQKIICLVRNYASHSALRVGNIAFITRDNMKMEMEDGLTGSRALVEPDVEAVWMETL